MAKRQQRRDERPGGPGSDLVVGGLGVEGGDISLAPPLIIM